MNWYPRPSTGTLTFFRQVPKVDLHRHLEGSLRLETLLEIAHQYDIPLPNGKLAPQVQVCRDDALTFTTFLSKFQVLRQFYRSPEIIKRVTREAVADAAADGVVYLELRFTPVALARIQGFDLGEVMDWVAESARQASLETGIQTRLIASINRHEPVAVGETVARLAAERRAPGIVGVDLAGNEAEFSALPFAGVMREASQSGLRLTIHGGEWGGAENVRLAIEALGAERIGHGVRAVEDPAVLALARERGTVFEVCLTSNYQSGVVTDLKAHPLPQMLDTGLTVTINTDDPSISGINLSDEYRLAAMELGLSAAFLKGLVINAARAAFLPAPESLALEQRLQAGIPLEIEEKP